jgi:hypothetical protein
VHYLGKGRSEPGYGAIVFASNRQPQWVVLGSAKEVDAMLASIKPWCAVLTIKGNFRKP